MDWFPRENYLRKIRDFYHETDLIKVITGVRRCGKSCLMETIADEIRKTGVKAENIIYFDLDRQEYNRITRAKELEQLIQDAAPDSSVKYLFLDEIQNVEGWHLFVNRMLRKKMHVIITGSNAKLLSGELATHLSGRNKEISLYPFSFKEFCVMKEVDTEHRTTKAEAFRRAAFDDYLKQGGFPELLTIDDNRNYVSSLVDNILKRDIEQRYKIAYKAAFENMAHHLLNVSPTIVVTTDLASLFHFKSEHTAKNYVKYLKEAYMLIGIQKYSQKSKQRSVQEKVYAVDVAMMDQRENAFAGENLGHRLETIVAVHLVRKCKSEGLDIYYLNDRSGECDFVVCKGNKVIQAIQVSYDISDEKTYRREKNGLLLAARQTKCEKLLLLTDHESSDIEEDGHQIKVQPVYEWSLEL